MTRVPLWFYQWAKCTVGQHDWMRPRAARLGLELVVCRRCGKRKLRGVVQ